LTYKSSQAGLLQALAGSGRPSSLLELTALRLMLEEPPLVGDSPERTALPLPNSTQTISSSSWIRAGQMSATALASASPARSSQ